MATIKPVWTENVSLRASATLGNGVSETNDIDLATLGADLVDITIDIVFGGSPDDDVLVEIFVSTDSGGEDDTVAAQSFVIEKATGATVRRSIVVAARAYVAVKVTNNDSTDDVTFEAHYAWRQWFSA